jgi:hypothetical protein
MEQELLLMMAVHPELQILEAAVVAQVEQLLVELVDPEWLYLRVQKLPHQQQEAQPQKQ